MKLTCATAIGMMEIGHGSVVRKLDDELTARLKRRAARHGRSTEAEPDRATELL